MQASKKTREEAALFAPVLASNDGRFTAQDLGISSKGADFFWNTMTYIKTLAAHADQMDPLDRGGFRSYWAEIESHIRNGDI